MRILITGMTGFVGGHLTELLLREGNHTLIGFGRGSKWPLNLSQLHAHTILHEGELADTGKLEAIFREHRPDAIYHLAGYANPGMSKGQPELCRASNVEGTRSLYEAVTRAKIAPRILLASTGQVYGPLEKHKNVIDENAPLNPDTPYSQSKLDAEHLSNEYLHLNILRVRMFNQIGPRQLGGYFTPDVTSEIVQLERGSRPALNDRNLSAYRDFTDVRDMVKALRVILNQGTPGEVYNACSGTVRSLYDVFATLAAHAKVNVNLPARPTNYGTPSYATSSERLKSLGWKPEIPWESTLADILEFWRNRN